MKTRKGYGLGKGMGYKNLMPMDSHIHSLSAKGVKTNQLVFIGVGEANAGREGIVTKVYLNKDIVDVRLFETEGEITSYDKNKIIPITNKPVISKNEFTFDAKAKKSKGKTKPLKMSYMNMFAIKTQPELLDYIEMFSSEEKPVAYLSYGLTWNMLSKELKKEKIADLKPMGMYAVKSEKELKDYMDKFSNKDEKRIMHMIYALTWNMVAKKVNEEKK